MLGYIACALGYLPRGARPVALLVTGRASLGLGGVAIVAAAVAGALGLTSALGLSASLISLEARPAHDDRKPLSVLRQKSRCASIMHCPAGSGLRW